MRLFKINKLIIVVVWILIGCNEQSDSEFTGYSYGDFIYLSHSTAEKIEQVYVKKGDLIKRGQELVKMESFTAENALSLAEKKLQIEHASLKNLQSGERPEELNVVRAQLDRARSAARLAKSQLVKYQPLFASNVITRLEWEKIQDDYEQKNAQVKELIHQIKAKQLPARQEQITSQASLVDFSRLEQDKALWDLQQIVITAPQDAQVYDIIYRAGERPTAGSPIITLLPPDNIKVRFFIPEKQLSNMHVGMKVQILFDECKEPVMGAINYISPQVEYTPPVIYSTERREKLIYMAEAKPVQDQRHFIKLGQPVRIKAVSGE